MRSRIPVRLLAVAIVLGGVLTASPALANSNQNVSTVKCGITYSGTFGYNTSGFPKSGTSRPSTGCGGGIAVQLLSYNQSTYLGITHAEVNNVSQSSGTSFYAPTANHWYLYQNANRSANQF